jgi:RNA polymerase sigma factor (sigma-70 family)
MGKMSTVDITIGLVAAARDGDQAAIDLLVALSQPKIRRYASFSCRAGDMEDASQETSWLLHQQIRRLRQAGAFSAWLFQVVRRTCIRLAKKTMHAMYPLDSVENSIGHAFFPDAALRLDLAAAIQSLPAHYMDVVVMRYIEELTVDQVAETLSLSREAVKARLRRALALLRGRLLQ